MTGQSVGSRGQRAVALAQRLSHRPRVGGPTGLLGVVGLDAADVGGLLGLQDLHQLQEAHLELGGHLVSEGQWEVGWSWADASDS